MTANISFLTTCTISLAAALTNLTPLETRAMEGSNLTSNQEEISQINSASGPSDRQRSGCVYVPGVGWVGDCGGKLDYD